MARHIPSPCISGSGRRANEGGGPDIHATAFPDLLAELDTPTSTAEMNPRGLALQRHGADLLAAACYTHVAPKHVLAHAKRIRAFVPEDFTLPGRLVLDSKASGIAFCDLFCGAGGLSLGFELETATCELALDYDSSSIQT